MSLKKLKVEDIINFLIEKPGYLKEGRFRLFTILSKRGYDCSIEDCTLALTEAKQIINNLQTNEVSLVKEEIQSDVLNDMEISSAWQTSSGTWRYSYKKKNTKEEVNYDDLLVKLRNSLSDLNNNIKINKSIELPSNTTKKLLEISLPDLHFGKGDIKELGDKFYNSVYNLINNLNLNQNINRILLPIGNDGLNSEGMRLTTTKGTPQVDTVDWMDSFTFYNKAVIEVINYLKTICPVDVLVVQGNHDFERAFYAGEVIKAYFVNDNNVTVDNSKEPRKYYSYGKCLLMFTHGDKEKASDMPLIMATEKPLEFANSKHREIHCGHFHKEVVLNEFRGIKVRFLPSICSTDDWHKQMGYDHYKAAQAFIWDEEKGLNGIIQENL